VVSQSVFREVKNAVEYGAVQGALLSLFKVTEGLAK